jgi:DNA-binding response OmpR family regulator
MVKILVIERSGTNEQSFVSPLERKGFEVYSVHTGKTALNLAKKKKPDLIVLDAASMGTSGDRICTQLGDSLNGIPIIHVRSEQHAVGDEKAGPAEVSLDMPFTSRKLINRVHRLLPEAPVDMLGQGPVMLDVDRRVVHAYAKQKRLTPKCAGLLELFLQHPGKTLSRVFLMKRVWKTDYVGDTRTLDVHVRWLREAVERKPARPRHIVTVRGLGYRFEPDPASAGPRATGKTSQQKSTGKPKK